MEDGWVKGRVLGALPTLFCGPLAPEGQAEALPGPQPLSVPRIAFQNRSADIAAHVRDAADDL